MYELLDVEHVLRGRRFYEKELKERTTMFFESQGKVYKLEEKIKCLEAELKAAKQ